MDDKLPVSNSSTVIKTSLALEPSEGPTIPWASSISPKVSPLPTFFSSKICFDSSYPYL